MKNLILSLTAVASLTIAHSSYAELNDMQKEMAESTGRTSASLLPSMKAFYSKPAAYNKYVRDSLATSATMFGCTTKEDILEFIAIAKKAMAEQEAVLSDVAKEDCF